MNLFSIVAGCGRVCDAAPLASSRLAVLRSSLLLAAGLLICGTCSSCALFCFRKVPRYLIIQNQSSEPVVIELELKAEPVCAPSELNPGMYVAFDLMGKYNGIYGNQVIPDDSFRIIASRGSDADPLTLSMAEIGASTAPCLNFGYRDIGGDYQVIVTDLEIVPVLKNGCGKGSVLNPRAQ